MSPTPERPAALVRLHQLSKAYLTDDMETHALDGLDLEIQGGEFLSITGPSGCGKSTLLSVLGLLDTGTQGRHEMAGVEVGSLNARQRAALRNREIGFVFQAFNLVGELSVEDNVGLPLLYRADLSRAERRERVAAALAQVDMVHRARHLPAQLSGGQQQRVAIARALVGQPRLILADEPTGNLDSRNAERVMELLCAAHAAGATLCMVTHDARQAALAARTVHMFDGRIVRDGALPTALAAPAAPAGASINAMRPAMPGVLHA